MKQGYKQTEAGVIPVDWEVFSLSELTEPQRPISYGIVQTGPSITNGVRCLRVIDIHEGKIKKSGLITTSKEISDSYRRTVLKAGDLVMPLRGKVGDVGLVDEELQGANLTRGVALIAIRSGWSPVFCQQVISSSCTIKRLEQAMNGSALQEIPIAALRSFQIATPKNIAEQRAIAGALSDVDALLTALDRLIAKKRDIKQAAMQQLLTGQTRLPGFEGEWEVKRLGEVAEITMGRTPFRLNSAYWGHGYPWLSIADLKDKVVSSSKEQITELAAEGMTVVPKGTLLMSFKLSIGRLCFAGCDLFTNEAICALRNPKADPEYVYYILMRTDFSLYGKQAVKGYTLNKQSLHGVLLQLPPLPEQRAIAEVLSDMDAELAALEERREKTRLLKQGMMQELLTGRIRLL